MKKPISVILAARDIPVNSKVTKRTGTAEFILSDVFTIYKENGGKQLMTAEEGTRFLIPNKASQSINVINGSTELTWSTDYETLMDFLQDAIAESESK